MTTIQKERALMLDMARKYYSKEWICHLIDYMAGLQLNALQLHFSENEGFRIQSDLYPTITSEQYLTKQEITEIIDYAKILQIDIIPDFDTPGHLQQVLAHYPEYQLDQIKDGQLVKDPRSLNIADQNARQFIKDLIKEYAQLFKDSAYFHIGADEFINFDEVNHYPQLVAYAKDHYGQQATGIETYIEYTNEIGDYIMELGFTPRVWNDGFYRQNQSPLVQLDKRIQVTYWTKWHDNMAQVEEFIKQGHQLLNFNDNYFYYVLGENASYTYPTAEKIKNEWELQKFAHEQWLTDEQMQSVIGTSFSIWSDIPAAQTEAEVLAGIKEPLKAMASKLMGG